MNAASPCVIAIRLADEGVPLRAIARATDIPSTQLYETLTIARMEGRLLSLPRDDWPPGCPRDQRSLQLSRLVTENHDTLMLAIQDIFDLTPLPAKLMLLLVQHEQVPHARIDVEHKSFGVHVCKMRPRLIRHGLEIKTLWGYGYQLSQEHRRKAMELILAKVALPGASHSVPSAPRSRTPISLTDNQQLAVLNATKPLAPAERTSFLTALTTWLADRDDVGDGELARELRTLQQQHFKPPQATAGHFRP